MFSHDPMESREQFEAEEMERLDDWAEAQHKALLESYAKSLWDTTLGIGGKRTPLHRLERIVTFALKIERRGVAEGFESDYQMDLLLTEWGPGRLIAYFGALAEVGQ